MSYVNEIKKGTATYDIQDKRIDDFPTNPSEDGAYYLKNTIANGVSTKQWGAINANERRVLELDLTPALTHEQWEAKYTELITNGELNLELSGVVPSRFTMGKDDVVLLTIFDETHVITFKVDNWVEDIDTGYSTSRQTICDAIINNDSWLVFVTGLVIGNTLGVYVKLLSKNETGSRSLTKTTRLVIGVRHSSLSNGNRNFILWFACDHFKLYAILNDGFTKINETLGQDVLNTHCATEDDLAANLQTLSLIEVPGASVPSQNMLVWNSIRLISRDDYCVKVTAPFLAEDGTELNSIDLIRTEDSDGGDFNYYNGSDRTWESYNLSEIYGQTDVTFSVHMMEM